MYVTQLKGRRSSSAFAALPSSSGTSTTPAVSESHDAKLQRRSKNDQNFAEVIRRQSMRTGSTAKERSRSVTALARGGRSGHEMGSDSDSDSSHDGDDDGMNDVDEGSDAGTPTSKARKKDQQVSLAMKAHTLGYQLPNSASEIRRIEEMQRTLHEETLNKAKHRLQNDEKTSLASWLTNHQDITLRELNLADSEKPVSAISVDDALGMGRYVMRSDLKMWMDRVEDINNQMRLQAGEWDSDDEREIDDTMTIQVQRVLTRDTERKARQASQTILHMADMLGSISERSFKIDNSGAIDDSEQLQILSQHVESWYEHFVKYGLPNQQEATDERGDRPPSANTMRRMQLETGIAAAAKTQHIMLTGPQLDQVLQAFYAQEQPNAVRKKAQSRVERRLVESLSREESKTSNLRRTVQLLSGKNEALEQTILTLQDKVREVQSATPHEMRDTSKVESLNTMEQTVVQVLARKQVREAQEAVATVKKAYEELKAEYTLSVKRGEELAATAERLQGEVKRIGDLWTQHQQLQEAEREEQQRLYGGQKDNQQHFLSVMGTTMRSSVYTVSALLKHIVEIEQHLVRVRESAFAREEEYKAREEHIEEHMNSVAEQWIKEQMLSAQQQQKQKNQEATSNRLGIATKNRRSSSLLLQQSTASDGLLNANASAATIVPSLTTPTDAQPGKSPRLTLPPLGKPTQSQSQLLSNPHSARTIDSSTPKQPRSPVDEGLLGVLMNLDATPDKQKQNPLSFTPLPEQELLGSGRTPFATPPTLPALDPEERALTASSFKMVEDWARDMAPSAVTEGARVAVNELEALCKAYTSVESPLDVPNGNGGTATSMRTPTQQKIKAGATRGGASPSSHQKQHGLMLVSDAPTTATIDGTAPLSPLAATGKQFAHAASEVVDPQRFLVDNIARRLDVAVSEARAKMRETRFMRATIRYIVSAVDAMVAGTYTDEQHGKRKFPALHVAGAVGTNTNSGEAGTGGDDEDLGNQVFPPKCVVEHDSDYAYAWVEETKLFETMFMTLRSVLADRALQQNTKEDAQDKLRNALDGAESKHKMHQHRLGNETTAATAGSSKQRRHRSTITLDANSTILGDATTSKGKSGGSERAKKKSIVSSTGSLDNVVGSHNTSTTGGEVSFVGSDGGSPAPQQGGAAGASGRSAATKKERELLSKLNKMAVASTVDHKLAAALHVQPTSTIPGSAPQHTSNRGSDHTVESTDHHSSSQPPPALQPVGGPSSTGNAQQQLRDIKNASDPQTLKSVEKDVKRLNKMFPVIAEKRRIEERGGRPDDDATPRDAYQNTDGTFSPSKKQRAMHNKAMTAAGTASPTSTKTIGEKRRATANVS